MSNSNSSSNDISDAVDNSYPPGTWGAYMASMLSSTSSAESMAATATHSSSPLIKIGGTGLQLMDIADIPTEGPIRVVSILGKARMGKSTFLNAILSRIEDRTVTPFMTQDNDEHCTRGIDYYFCKKERLLLLDCQGLALEDSSHDPQLLLFAYLVSDVIILNERMMLQNEALKLMEPICTFMTYIDTESIPKPQLYFRISDGDLVKDPHKNLERVLTRYPDQYQSIRDSIAHLFQYDIGIVKTDTMDRSQKEALQKNDYMALLKDQSLGFQRAVDTLLVSLPKGRDAREWKSSLPRIIHNINHNEKISIDKLDIVFAWAKLELLEYEKTIPVAVFADIPVTETQESYDRLVAPRIQAQQYWLNDFSRKFKSVSKEIKDRFFQDLSERLARPIQLAKDTMTQLAEQHATPYFAVASQDRSYPSLHNLQTSFTSRPTWESYLVGFQALKTAIQPLYEPVRIKYETWMDARMKQLMDTVSACVKIETENLIQAATHVGQALRKCYGQCLDKISRLIAIDNQQGKEESILIQDPGSLVERFMAAATAFIAKELGAIPKPMALRISMTNKMLVIHHDYGLASRDVVVDSIMTHDHSFPITHDLLAQVYRPWTDGIVALGVRLTKAVTERKKQLLFGFRFVSTMGIELFHTQIKDVDFVCVKHVGYMTAETFHQCYMPLVTQAIQQMSAKGFLVEGDADDFVKINTIHSRPGTTVFPLKFVLTQKMEIAQSGNVVGNYVIGDHPEPALAHLFKTIHSEIMALERAKPKEDSLFVHRKLEL